MKVKYSEDLKKRYKDTEVASSSYLGYTPKQQRKKKKKKKT